MLRHILIRIALFFVLLLIGFAYCYFAIDKAGGRSFFAFIAFSFALLFAFGLYLLLESIQLHKKSRPHLRNLNIMIGIVCVIMPVLWTGRFFFRIF